MINEEALERIFAELACDVELTLSNAKNLIIQTKKTERMAEVAANRQLWMDKHEPKSTKDIIGNNLSISELNYWLDCWTHIIDNNLTCNSECFTFARACLLSGPHGVGKTSVAKLSCKENGYDIIETNASDHRNKKWLEDLLSDAISCKSLEFTTNDQNKNRKKAAILMDEIEAMNETSNKGGIHLLADLIKITQVPIICICENSNSSKVRPIFNLCSHITFEKPQRQIVKEKFLAILKEENSELDNSTIDAIIETTGSDIRQGLNMLEMCSKRQSEPDSSQ